MVAGLILAVVVAVLCFAHGEEEKTPKDFSYSKIVCDYLLDEYDVEDCLSRKVTEQTSSYTKCSESFFTNKEIEEFLSPLKITEEDLHRMVDPTINEIKKNLEEVKKELGSNPLTKDYVKMIDGVLDILDYAVSKVFAIIFGGFSVSNEFALGAVSLATCPIGHFDEDTGRPVVTESIIKDVTNGCNKYIDLFINGLIEIANKFMNLSIPKELKDYLAVFDEVKKQLNTIKKQIHDKELCEYMAKTMEFGAEFITIKNFSYIIEPIIEYLEELFGGLYFLPSSVSVQDAANKVFDILRMPFHTHTSEERTETLKVDSKGFDMAEAAKDTPDYKDMVVENEDISDNYTSGGQLPVWAIILIVVGAVVIAGGAGFAIFYFVKRSKRAESGDDRNAYVLN